MYIFAPHLLDGYKTSHPDQYPDKTECVCSNWTPRKSRLEGVNHSVFFGLQYYIKEYLIKQWNESFFQKDKQTVVKKYARRMKNYLGDSAPGTDRLAALYDLGYMPVLIKALPEGAKSIVRVPQFTIRSTQKQFYWVTNMLETQMSCTLWQPSVSATIANNFYLMLKLWQEETDPAADWFPKYQGHDFSMRGMSSVETACTSGAGHLLSFYGTDTIPAIDFLEEYYNANSDEEIVGESVPATEHAVMCMGTQEDEIGTLRRLLKTYPKGILSVVSDTWDLWRLITEYLPLLKDEILAREGKLVIRPDSSKTTPQDILCGTPGSTNKAEEKGVTQCLAEIFGTDTNEKGFQTLNPKIGSIYGDAINYERAYEICSRHARMGFASTNYVLGIGSFTYQMNTRDTLGYALKATWGEVDGKFRAIFKDPVTDSGEKTSAKGRIQVQRAPNGCYYYVDGVDVTQEQVGELKPVFQDGKLLKNWYLKDVRQTLEEHNAPRQNTLEGFQDDNG